MGFVTQWVWYLLAFLLGSGVVWLLAVIWFKNSIEEDDS
jgi:uncharacterized membrane protein ArfB